MAKILIVDDDLAMAREIDAALKTKSYLVDVANTGADAKAYLKAVCYDLVVLDWQLPDTTGIEICRKIRNSEHPGVPVLFLTGRTAINDKEVGFDSGADDYLTKPFSMAEFLARVKALLKRPPIQKGTTLKARSVTLNTQTREVFQDSREIKLLPKEFALLEFFMSHPNQIYTADQVLGYVWATDDDSSAETLRVTLMRLRKKLNFPDDEQLIVTLRNVGYRLEA